MQTDIWDSHGFPSVRLNWQSCHGGCRECALASYDIQLPFWKRYVDDVITVVCVDRVQHLLEHLNSIECSIQFMVEVKNDGEVPILDVNVYQDLMALSTHQYIENQLILIDTLTSPRTILSLIRELSYVPSLLGYPPIHHQNVNVSMKPAVLHLT